MKLIVELSDRIKYGIDTGITKNGSIACKVALNAIKNGIEIKSCNDVINRKEVKEAFIHWYSDLLESHKEDQDFQDIIDSLQSVQPTQKTGFWRPVYQGDEIINYRCTECEYGNTFSKSTHNMNYCPSCGSKNEELIFQDKDYYIKKYQEKNKEIRKNHTEDEVPDIFWKTADADEIAGFYLAADTGNEKPIDTWRSIVKNKEDKLVKKVTYILDHFN